MFPPLQLLESFHNNFTKFVVPSYPYCFLLVLNVIYWDVMSIYKTCAFFFHTFFFTLEKWVSSQENCASAIVIEK